MDPAAVCAGVSSVMGSGEHGLDMLVLAVVGDACLVAAHHVIEVVDSRGKGSAVLLCDLAVLDDVERASRSYGSKTLYLLVVEVEFTRPEDYSLELTACALADLLAAIQGIESHEHPDEDHVAPDLLG